MDLLNTHLESTAEHAEERTRQLEKCFEIMSKRPGDRTVIFGGDLNSRDKEVEDINNILSRYHIVKGCERGAAYWRAGRVGGAGQQGGGSLHLGPHQEHQPGVGRQVEAAVPVSCHGYYKSSSYLLYLELLLTFCLFVSGSTEFTSDPATAGTAWLSSSGWWG